MTKAPTKKPADEPKKAPAKEPEQEAPVPEKAEPLDIPANEPYPTGGRKE